METNDKKQPTHAQLAMLDNIQQNLIELMADYLDSESLKLDEAIAVMKDPVSREESELHIRMANASFEEYKRTMLPNQFTPVSDGLPSMDELDSLELDLIKEEEAVDFVEWLEPNKKWKMNVPDGTSKFNWVYMTSKEAYQQYQLFKTAK